MSAPKNPCKRCGERWAQRRGLCATCAVHLAKIAPRRVVSPESRVPRPDRVVTINGHDYAVVWDGA